MQQQGTDNKMQQQGTGNKANQQGADKKPTRCFPCSRHQRVHPLSPTFNKNEQVEIQPNRVLHIQHINAQLCDTLFEEEMKYKSQGVTLTESLSLTDAKQTLQTTGIANTKPTQLASSVNNFKHQMALHNSAANECGGGDSNGKEVDVVKIRTELASTSHLVCIPQCGSSSAHNVGETLTAVVSNSHGSQQLSKKRNSELSNSLLESVQLNAAPADIRSASLHGTSKTDSVSLEKQPFESSLQCGSIISPKRSFTLFFIHGVGGSSNVWQAQLKYFAQKGYEVVAPDLVGHGLSCAPRHARAYHFSEIAADLEIIFDKYCKKKNVVIGHSYGCSFAVRLARIRSRRVQKLVLISGGAPTPLAAQPSIFALPICLLQCFRPCLNCTFRKSAFHSSGQAMLSKEESFSIPTYVLQHMMNGQEWPDGDEDYHQWLLCPTLLIYGAQDKLITLQEEEHMKEVIFHSQLEVIPNASHMVMIEAPDEVNRLLFCFLNEAVITCTSSPQLPVHPEGRSIS